MARRTLRANPRFAGGRVVPHLYPADVPLPRERSRQPYDPAQVDGYLALADAQPVSTWLSGGVPPAQVAEWAGHSVAVLLKVYAKCIDGQDQIAKRRIEDALRETGEA